MMGGGIPGKKFPGTLNRNALHVYVEDADAVCKRAVAAGATLVDEPRDQEYGERSGTVKDPAGNYWYVATHQGKESCSQGSAQREPVPAPTAGGAAYQLPEACFRAEEVAKYASPDGVVHHAVIRMGDSVVEMGEAHGKYRADAGDVLSVRTERGCCLSNRQWQRVRLRSRSQRTSSTGTAARACRTRSATRGISLHT